MRLCELKGKTVINDTDCCILGFVVDIDFDPSSGCILALIVPGPARLCGLLGRDFEYVIPFKCIRTIGPDIILVTGCCASWRRWNCAYRLTMARRRDFPENSIVRRLRNYPWCTSFPISSVKQLRRWCCLHHFSVRCSTN